MPSLAEHLESAYPLPETDEERQGIRITNPDMASWAMRKLAKCVEKKRSINEQADLEILRINDWRKAELARIERDEAFFTGLLAEYHASILAVDPKAITLHLPHGTTQFRKQPPEFKRDDAKLLAFLEADPSRAEFIRLKREPDWAKLKPTLILGPNGQVVTQDGEVVPGVVYEERPPAFSVKLTTDGKGGAEA